MLYKVVSLSLAIELFLLQKYNQLCIEESIVFCYTLRFKFQLNIKSVTFVEILIFLVKIFNLCFYLFCCKIYDFIKPFGKIEAFHPLVILFEQMRMREIFMSRYMAV